MAPIKKIFVLLILILLTNTSLTFAIEESSVNQEIVQKELNLTTKDAIIFLGALIENIPESYKYIQLNFKNIEKGSKIENTLQKLVYLNKIKNANINLGLNNNINALEFYILAKNVFDFDDLIQLNETNLKARKVNENDFVFVQNLYKVVQENKVKENIQIIDISNKTLGNKEGIFNDVYDTLLNGYYDSENLNPDDLIYGAIEGLAKGTHDEHTVFFPPIESRSFEDSLAAEFEGIGAYIELAAPGQPRIVNPIPGSPAEKTGLKAGDIIIKVDEKEVSKNNTLSEVTSWIKGIAGTNVKLLIIRNGEELEFNIVREKIMVKMIETKEISSNTFLIKINSFGAGVANEFKNALDEVKVKSNIKKIIFDLRNDGGGYVNETTELLSYLVPEGKNLLTFKYIGFSENIPSSGYDGINLNNYKIIILENGGTASSSEIMIGTLKDYFPNIIVMGETSYGKGSAQTVREYTDGSSLKYTIAKWFTGGTETGIDGIGIKPDIEVELDIEAYQKGIDNQLQKAIEY